MVLFRMTGNPQYREWGWEIFQVSYRPRFSFYSLPLDWQRRIRRQAIERHCRTPAAYGTVKDVRRADPEINDSLQTFFFAETLKCATASAMQAAGQWRCALPCHALCARTGFGFGSAALRRYLYLLFSERDVLSLDKYVFNTEAHPFRIKPNERLSADPQD